MFTLLLLWSMLILPWFILIPLRSYQVKRFFPGGVFGALLLTVVFQMARRFRLVESDKDDPIVYEHHFFCVRSVPCGNNRDFIFYVRTFLAVFHHEPRRGCLSRVSRESVVRVLRDLRAAQDSSAWGVWRHDHSERVDLCVYEMAGWCDGEVGLPFLGVLFFYGVMQASREWNAGIILHYIT
ncbi:hypothetical protein RKD55_000823 [Rossellomorea marisflavi]